MASLRWPILVLLLVAVLACEQTATADQTPEPLQFTPTPRHTAMPNIKPPTSTPKQHLNVTLDRFRRAMAVDDPTLRIACTTRFGKGACLGLSYDNRKELAGLRFLSIENKSQWMVTVAWQDTRPRRTEWELCTGYHQEQGTWECETSRKTPNEARNETDKFLKREWRSLLTSWQTEWPQLVREYERAGALPVVKVPTPTPNPRTIFLTTMRRFSSIEGVFDKVSCDIASTGRGECFYYGELHPDYFVGFLYRQDGDRVITWTLVPVSYSSQYQYRLSKCATELPYTNCFREDQEWYRHRPLLKELRQAFRLW